MDLILTQPTMSMSTGVGFTSEAAQGASGTAGSANCVAVDFGSVTENGFRIWAALESTSIAEGLGGEAGCTSTSG